MHMFRCSYTCTHVCVQALGSNGLHCVAHGALRPDVHACHGCHFCMFAYAPTVACWPRLTSQHIAHPKPRAARIVMYACSCYVCVVLFVLVELVSVCVLFCLCVFIGLVFKWARSLPTQSRTQPRYRDSGAAAPATSAVTRSHCRGGGQAAPPRIAF